MLPLAEVDVNLLMHRPLYRSIDRSERLFLKHGSVAVATERPAAAHRFCKQFVAKESLMRGSVCERERERDGKTIPERGDLERGNSKSKRDFFSRWHRQLSTGS